MTLQILLPLTVSLLVTAVVTPIAADLARWCKWVDYPGPRKIHRQPTPLLGGCAVAVGLVAGVIVGALSGVWSPGPPGGLGFDRRHITTAVGGLILLIVGLLDDRGFLHHQVKLQMAMPMVAVLLLAAGVRVAVFEGSATTSLSTFDLLQALPVTFIVLANRILDAALTCLWVVGVTASFSILDHMDGLCAGIAGFAGGTIGGVALGVGIEGIPLAASALVGACIGFLFWNFKPASIFLGDGGAMLLGYLCAVLGLMLDAGADGAPWAPLVAVFALSVPLFDTSLIIVSRWRRGLVPFRAPGKDHAAHRLVEAGFGEKGAVLMLYAGAAAGGLVALLAPRLSEPRHLSILATIAAGVGLVGLAVFERLPYKRQEDAEALKSTRGEEVRIR